MSPLVLLGFQPCKVTIIFGLSGNRVPSGQTIGMSIERRIPHRDFQAQATPNGWIDTGALQSSSLRSPSLRPLQSCQQSWIGINGLSFPP